MHTYWIWGISSYRRGTEQSKHILQVRSLRLALTLGEAGLSSTKAAQSGWHTIAWDHYLGAIGIHSDHESMYYIIPLVVDQMRGASPSKPR